MAGAQPYRHSLFDLKRHQLQGPSRSLPAEASRRHVQQGKQIVHKFRGHFAGFGMKPPIGKSGFTQLFEPGHRSVDSGPSASHHLRSGGGGIARIQKEENSATSCFDEISGFSEPAFDAAALRTIKIRSYIHDWEVLCEKVEGCGYHPTYSGGFPFQYCPIGSYCTSGSLIFDPGRMQAI
jgi:hypothetical protein